MIGASSGRDPACQARAPVGRAIPEPSDVLDAGLQRVLP
jgi:hypothetical protein